MGFFFQTLLLGFADPDAEATAAGPTTAGGVPLNDAAAHLEKVRFEDGCKLRNRKVAENLQILSNNKLEKSFFYVLL